MKKKTTPKAAANRTALPPDPSGAHNWAIPDADKIARRRWRDAILQLGKALAIRHRLPEPATLEDTLAPHLLAAWEDLGVPLRDLLDNASPPDSYPIGQFARLAS
ncbi:MAG TPA: hypothetical protein DCM68_03460 [Verrucomicrobia bacterium]|nr:hypothetical protein [Verrucomicrobiota bacterium]